MGLRAAAVAFQPVVRAGASTSLLAGEIAAAVFLDRLAVAAFVDAFVLLSARGVPRGGRLAAEVAVFADSTAVVVAGAVVVAVVVGGAGAAVFVLAPVVDIAAILVASSQFLQAVAHHCCYCYSD